MRQTIASEQSFAINYLVSFSLATSIPTTSLTSLIMVTHLKRELLMESSNWLNSAMTH